MILHFQFQSMFSNQQLPGWTFSFYFQQTKMTGLYQADGQIHWTSNVPDNVKTELEKQVHDLMIFHVYDRMR